jgi:hypothetical protein
VLWRPLQHSTVLELLHHPRYAGAFVFGRHRTSMTVGGRTQVTVLPREQWFALFPGAHAGYITWEEFEANERQLRQNAQAYATERTPSPPREGPALLQGLAICGRCGERMGVHYHERRGRLIPEYVCQQATIEYGKPPCQRVPGAAVDAAIGELLLAALTPVAVEVALAVEAEVTARAQEADRLRQQHVERARYEADLAQRRYLRVDPDNRLVADVLEAQWNAKLRDLAAAQEELERRRQAGRPVVTEADRAELLALTSDFPRLWRNATTPDRERRRMVRLLLEDVTLRKADQLTLQVRFKGGATQTQTLPLPLPAWALRRTEQAVVGEIDALLNMYTDGQVAERLNAAGRRSFDGKPFHKLMIASIRQHHHLPDRYTRLRARGLLTVEELATRLGVCVGTVEVWRERGLLHAEPYNDRGQYLYPLPDGPGPVKWKHKALHREVVPEARHGGAV